MHAFIKNKDLYNIFDYYMLDKKQAIKQITNIGEKNPEIHLLLLSSKMLQNN